LDFREFGLDLRLADDDFLEGSKFLVEEEENEIVVSHETKSEFLHFDKIAIFGGEQGL
jgi:hypothetical protein